MIKFGVDLRVEFLEQGVRRDDSILKYHNAFEDAGQAAASFQMANVRFDRATAGYRIKSVTLKGQ